MLGPLYYPKGMIRQQTPTQCDDPGRDKERARKRAEQLARQREKARDKRGLRGRKREREKAEKEKQIAEAKAAEEKKKADEKPVAFGEFNRNRPQGCESGRFMCSIKRADSTSTLHTSR